MVFTPTHASWLNQVEIFFFDPHPPAAQTWPVHRPHDLSTQMLAFVEHYNQTSKPFAWTYTGKVLVA
jgi:hypothetical protein